jgi:LPS sulfotransferase NodH
LIDLLNSNRNVYSYSEIFSGVGENEVDRVYAEWRRPKPFFIHAVGCKVFYYHPQAGAESKLWQMLEADTDIRVIHLRRLNILETVISERRAAASNHWISFGNDSAPAQAPISLTPEAVERDFRETRAWEQECDERFRDHAVCQLLYEDLAADPYGTARLVFEFLGAPVRQPRSRLVKQTGGKTSRKLANWDELREHFRGTEWEQFFRE